MAGILLVFLALAQQSEPVDFQRDIRPILSDRCFTCHGPDAAAREADLRLDTREGALADLGGYAAITPGDLEASELWFRITTEHQADVMPPVDSGLELSAAERDKLRAWIEQGAGYQQHWAFAPPTDPAPPELDDPWPTDPIDAFVLAKLKEADFSPMDDVDDGLWLRRVSFSLTGLPPAPSLQAAFAAGELNKAAVVDRLLASPHFGEHFAATWLDVARYADTYGYQNDRERRVWPYRDWVIAAYNDNLPYDDFLRWQIAGDLLPEPTRDSLIATAFQRLHRQTNEGGSVEEEFRVEYVSDRVHTTGTAFLGLTFECARCHDHKYDPISQREYFQLTDYFDDIDESGLYSHFTNATPTPALDLSSAEQSTALAAAELAVDAAEQAWRAARQQHPKNAGLPPAQEVVFPLNAVTERKSPGIGAPDAEARMEGAFQVVPGASGQAIRLSGDDGIRFSKVGQWGRWDAFGVGLRLRIDEPVERAILLHRSRAWHDAASQGWQLLLEDGRLTAALVHFWPGDMAAIRTVEPLPIGEWLELEWRYDGSSRAAGMQLWVNGEPAATEVVRDALTRSITGGGPGEVSFGARFRDRGFSQGALDEVRFFSYPIPTDPSTLSDPGRLYAELLQARITRDQLRDRIPQLMVMRDFATPREARFLHRGAYDAPGEVVGRGVPAALQHTVGSTPPDRLALADWMLAADHPLTARVEVDRLWRTVFGAGLVRTPENWGSQGEAPTHPALLDRLARDFIASGWDRKALIRRMVLSRTFAQRAGYQEQDPENRLWSSGPARRLTAEQLRDAALAQAGLLVRQVGGPSVKPYQPDGLWQEKSGVRYQPSKGDGLYRRSLYTFWKRTSPPPSMMVFDAAKRDVCVVKRQVTNTPLQALALWNDPQQMEAARVLAAATLPQQDDELPTAVRKLTRQLGGTAPDAACQALAQLYQSELEAFRADPAAAQALLAIGEAPPADHLDPAQHAAWAVVCSTLLSSELVVMLR